MKRFCIASFMLTAFDTIHAQSIKSERQDFIDARKCVVLERFQMVYNNKSFVQNRYLVLSAKNNEKGYVQCLFQENDTKLLCESSSGYFNKKAKNHSKPSPDYLASLTRLGFSTDHSKGNFQRMFEIKDKYDLVGVSETLLSAFYELHGARLNSEFVWNAPLATLPIGQNSSTCSPVS
jgi:cell division protein FtsI/penicillin-binding protein 2